jgi:hypothetical protein
MHLYQLNHMHVRVLLNESRHNLCVCELQHIYPGFQCCEHRKQRFDEQGSDAALNICMHACCRNREHEREDR